jgi:hypothetical protein
MAKKFRIVGRPFSIVSRTHQTESYRRFRLVVVVEVGKNRTAFYRSTGTGTPGEVKAGEWVPFGGLSRKEWFIKAYYSKIPEGEMAEVSQWLATQKIGAPEQVIESAHWWKVNNLLKKKGVVCDESRFRCIEYSPKWPPPSASILYEEPDAKAQAIIQKKLDGFDEWADQANKEEDDYMQGLIERIKKAREEAAKPKVTKPKAAKPKAAKPTRKRTKATKPKATKDAAHYFSMGSKDLLRDGSAGAKKELRRRGRDPRTGKKV